MGHKATGHFRCVACLYSIGYKPLNLDYEIVFKTSVLATREGEKGGGSERFLVIDTDCKAQCTGASLGFSMIAH